jgi:hypothetical protein
MSEVCTLSIEVYRHGVELQRIGSRAVKKAQEESRRLKVPNVYTHNGTLYYELPDGRLTTVDPFEDVKVK